MGVLYGWIIFTRASQQTIYRSARINTIGEDVPGGEEEGETKKYHINCAPCLTPTACTGDLLSARDVRCENDGIYIGPGNNFRIRVSLGRAENERTGKKRKLN